MHAHRSQRLQPLQQVAEQREDEALRQLAECQRNERDHEQRLSDLRRYMAEYSQQDAAVCTPALLNNRLGFLARLREAEKMQLQLLEQAREQTQTERARWMLKRRDTGVLEQLAAAYRVQERRQSERHEQKNLDELASQMKLRAAARDENAAPALGTGCE